jgi:hypothetical protein
VLSALFTPVLYHVPAPLDDGNYCNLLYQEGIHPKLLDYLGNKYSFRPVLIARALHEGEAIESVGRYVNSEYALSPEMARQIGDIYLLVFAAVALRRFDELSYDEKTAYSEEVNSFLESLRQDGYSYHGGHIYDSNGSTIVPVPLSGAVAVSKPAVARKEVPQAATESFSPPTRTRVTEPAIARVGKPEKTTRRNWTIEAKIGLWSLVALIIIGIATLIATVASPEVRTWLHLSKPESSGTGSEKSTAVPSSESTTSAASPAKVKGATAAGIEQLREHNRVERIRETQFKKTVSSIPAGSFGFAVVTSLIHQGHQEMPVTPHGSNYEFEVHKLQDGQLELVAYVQPATVGRVIAGLNESEKVTVYSRPWKEAPNVVALPLRDFQCEDPRQVVATRHSVEAVDCAVK